MISSTEFQLQYRAVKEKIGLFDLPNRGKIEVRGEEAREFLNNLLTNDIKGLKVPDICYSALLDQKGKVLADLYVWSQPDRFILETEPFLFPIIQEKLHTYLVSEQVTFQDRTHDYFVIAIEGPQSDLLHNRITPLQSLGILVGERSMIGGKGYSLMIPHEVFGDFFPKLLKEGGDFGMFLVDPLVQECLRIEAGIPRWGQDFTQENLLPEARLFRAVSFTKGCYIGQEIIARMKSFAHPNRQLVGLKINSEIVPEPKHKVFDVNKEVGWITSSCFSPEWTSSLALGYVGRPYAQERRSLELEQHHRRVSVVVVSLPGLPIG